MQRSRWLERTSFIPLLIAVGLSVRAQKVAPPPSPVALGKEGRLVYTPDALGNRVPDFSYSGYRAGAEAIPFVAVKVRVPVKQGDATARIQSAIDYVSALQPDKDGFRGAVLLEKGIYSVSGTLRIRVSGVVLRGSGAGNGTTILGTGTTRETLITISGKSDRSVKPAVRILNEYVPVSATTIRVADPAAFKAGDRVIVNRPSTKAWIDLLHTAEFGGGESALGWKPGQREISWDRQLVAVDGNTLTIDAPLTTALDTAFGGGSVATYTWPGRAAQCGVENLVLQSTFDPGNPKDEAHRWMAIVIANAMDVWVRQVNFKHFAGSAVMIQETAKRATVEDCQSTEPVSEIGGERRNTFFTAGQQTLFQRIHAENGYHDFAVGFCAAGPNAFVQCESIQPYGFSGPIDSWASGVLFDIVNVDGQSLSYKNREQDGQGAGWNAANSMFWQCTAARIDCYKPPGAMNWAYGSWSQFGGDGYWESSNEQIQPRSFYYAQLKDRIGANGTARAYLVNIGSEASSSPPVDVALKLTKEAYSPAPLLVTLIDEAAKRNSYPAVAATVKAIDEIGIKTPGPVATLPPLMVTGGVLTRGSAVVSGKTADVPWWTGSARPYALPKMKAAVTRFVPGRIGKGLTDDLDEVTDSMKLGNVVALDQNYGLWYERRRDDHERIRRADGDVWAPFYELPFARSGQSAGWDGLSKYDLTKYNPFYWGRLKQFADLADQKGLLLMNENYFQHNIIEAGAHYADFPWRPVNNINNTGFPEPVNYAGDKRLFMAEQFYDTTNVTRNALHRAFVRQNLDNFADNSGVIQLISAEYTGPLHFVRFWLDVIGEWEKEKGKSELIALSTTKDVQDAILADPRRAKLIDVIDIRYWHYQADGKAYAPEGGQNLAPRQHARLLKPKAASFESVYRAVAEYREKYPEKAVIYNGESGEANGWAIFMAGGSLAPIPKMPEDFLRAAALMKPVTPSDKGSYILSAAGKGWILYSVSEGAASIDLSGASGSYTITWFDAKTGLQMPANQKIKGGLRATIYPPKQGLIAWIKKG